MKKRPDQSAIVSGMPMWLPNSMQPLYEQLSQYESYVPKVRFFKHVFVTRSGLVSRGPLLIRESAYRYPDRFWKYQKAVWWNLFTKKKIFTEKSETYTLGHNFYCPGYYHWLTEALPRIWALGDHLSELVLLLPTNQPSYVTDSLDAFLFKKKQWIPAGYQAFVHRLVITENPVNGESFHAETMQAMGKYLVHFARKRHPSSPLKQTRKIYISRKLASKRKVVNEQALTQALVTLGFELVYAEEMDFWEQVWLFSQCSCLVSIHGAALSNMLFIPEGGKVVELYKEPEKGEYLNICYWRLSDAMRLQYALHFCRPEVPGVALNEADIIVDVPSLIRKLIQLMT